MTPTAVLFPGQGSLTPDSADAARACCPELVDEAIKVLGCDPFEHAQESTAYAQPAIFLASMAGWRAHERDLTDVLAMAGHSLGELSALAAAGAVTVDDALWLVIQRGRLMESAAAAHGRGGMVALLGAEPDDAAAVAAEYELIVANDNAPGQVVLSGDRAAIESLAGSARARGFKALMLDVAGAFHSPAVAAAREPFLEALTAVKWKQPSVTVVSAMTAAPFTDIPRELSDAVASPVRWRETMTALYDLGAREFVDAGPGKVLARLASRNLPTQESHALAG